ncbi:hypothetical protein [Streptomyces sp. ISL-11]|uniref:hypothetical protein n=1 Tax=Streptomyces sp. ISL-11 TaxID=2819174 RepID=UPI001BEA9CB9|nr:hypothetical protein [Streptomyces sp. ISL-11]MBT2382144.1 hypothetical protein [Streptomyces sp. ISL-11]
MTDAAGTRPYLIRRLAVLLTATVLACGTLLAAYYGVSRNAGAVSGRTAPAMAQVAGARTALLDSYREASGNLGDRGTAPVEGPGEKYRADLNAAEQSLEKAAQSTVARGDGQETLRTATGLVSSYDFLIQQAARNVGNPVLHGSYMGYAHRTLTREGSGIVPLLDHVQNRQRAVLNGQASFGVLLWLTWIMAYVFCGALVWLLVDTQRSLRLRFRRRLNPPLAAATALVAAVAPLTYFSLFIQHRLGAAADRLHTSWITKETLNGVRDTLAGTHWRAGATGWIPLAGFVVAALVVTGLQPRVEEYRFEKALHRPGARPRTHQVTAALLALWLVLFGAVGFGDQRGGGRSRVTVVAPWTGEEGKRFRAVLDRFSREEHIAVSYQGTTSLRDVLISRVNAGAAPDLAILPGVGEVSEYLADRQLRRLDDGPDPVLSKAELASYGKPWTPADGPVYAVPVKVDLKSVVWFDPTRGQPAALAARGGPWCAGMGGDATSGWPGTDWVEDILLQQHDETAYARWVRGDLAWSSDAVKDAWRYLGRLIGAGSARSALAQDFTQGPFPAGKGEKTTCALQHQGSFIRATYREGSGASFALSRDVLPGLDGSSRAREVSADFATLFRDSPQTRKLLRFLTRDAQKAWTEPGPGASAAGNPLRPFFANPLAAPPPGEKLNARIDKELHDGARLCLDASDVMPLRMRSAFQHGVLDYLSRPDEANLKRVTDYLDAVKDQLKADGRYLTPGAVCG